tara:strand:+ start:186 stop:452 length:267 start_codon:yes stop_codon:yes gene_type:complete
VKGDTGSKRIALECEHQSGVLYVVPAESSWVCSDDLLPVHALAGFFRQLKELDDPAVEDAMQRWGLYYRTREVGSEGQDGQADPETSS